MTDKNENMMENIVRGAIILSLISGFIPGPAVSIGPLDLIMFDLVIVFLTLSLAGYLFYDFELVLPKHRLIGITSVAYFGLAFGLPVTGLIVYDNPIIYFVGDLRWIQVFIIGFAILSLYDQSAARFVFDIELAMRLIIVCNFLVFGLQFLDANDIITTHPILDIWYYGQTPYGGTGYHINRYAGATTTSSNLGLITAVSVALFGRSTLVSHRGSVYFILSVALLLASGHRTSLVAVMGIFGVFLVYVFLNHSPSDQLKKKIGAGIIAIIVSFPIIYWLNIGRVATSDRYSEIITVVLNPIRFFEISGRGTVWKTALSNAETYPMGTLSNPAWVIKEPSVIDSYFIMTYIQGEFLFTSIYILFLLILLIVSIRLLTSEDRAILTISFVIVIIFHSITQNFMTGLSGKVITLLSVIILILILVNMRRKSHRTIDLP